MSWLVVSRSVKRFFRMERNCNALRLPSGRSGSSVGEHEARELTRLEAKLDEPGGSEC